MWPNSPAPPAMPVTSRPLLDNGAADAQIDLEQHEIVLADGRAPHQLGNGRAVALIVGEDRLLQDGPEHISYVDAGPCWNDAGAQHHSIAADRAGDGDTNPQEPRHRQTVFPVRLGNCRFGHLGRLLRLVVQSHWDSLFSNDGMRDIGDDEPYLLKTQVNSDAGARCRIERHGRGWPADSL